MRFRLLQMIFCVLTVGCLAASSPAAAGALRVGLLLPLSGPLAQAGESARNAAEMAVEGAGNISLQIADTAGTSEGARDAAGRLIDSQQVHAMVGTLASPAAWAAAEAAETAGVPLLICGASAPAITGRPLQYVFRLNPTTDEKYAVLASFLDRFSAQDRSTAVFCEDSPSATALSEAWLSAAPVVKLDPMYRIVFSAGLVDYRPELARARVKQPAIEVLIADPADGARMMRQSRRMNLAPALILGDAAGFARPAFAEAAGAFGEYVCALVPWAPSAAYPGARRFSESYQDRYGRVPGYPAAMTYAALRVLEDAAGRAGTEDGAALRGALAVADTTTICGRVRFDPKSARPGQNQSSWLLVQWQSGRLETVWPPNRASAAPVFPFPAWRSRRDLEAPDGSRPPP